MILVVSNEPMDRDGIVGLLKAHAPDFGVRVAETASAALEVVQAGPCPRLALVLHSSVGPLGWAALRILRAAAPGMHVAIYGSLDADMARRWVAEGVDAVIPRTLPADAFARAILYAAAGGRFVPPELIGGAHAEGRALPGTSITAWTEGGAPLIELLPVGAILVVGDRIAYANPRALALLGYEPQELLAMRTWELVAPERREEVRELTAARIAGLRRNHHLVLPLRRKDGTEAWIEMRGRAVPLCGIPSLVAVMHDVTGRIPILRSVHGGPVPLLEISRQFVGTPPVRQPPAAGSAPGPTPGPAAGAAAGSAPAPATATAPAPRAPPAGPGPRADIAALTERQRQVLELLMTGATNKEIAARLAISEATAKLHILHILRALGASNRTEAAIIAQRVLSGEA